MVKKAKWLVYRNVEDKWCFRLVGPNGENILQSEGYTLEKSCTELVKTIQKYAASANMEVEK